VEFFVPNEVVAGWLTELQTRDVSVNKIAAHLAALDGSAQA